MAGPQGQRRASLAGRGFGSRSLGLWAPGDELELGGSWLRSQREVEARGQTVCFSASGDRVGVQRR